MGSQTLQALSSLKDPALAYSSGRFFLFVSDFSGPINALDSHLVGVSTTDFRQYDLVLDHADGASPTLFSEGGKHYLCFCSGFGLNSRHGHKLWVSTSTDLRSWSTPVPLASAVTGGARAIDPALGRVDGRLWLVYKEGKRRATHCALCRKQFHALLWKHRCRRCREIFCHHCSPHRVALPAAHALVVPSEKLEKVATQYWKVPDGRLHRISNGIDTSLYGKPAKPDAIPGFTKKEGEIVIGTIAGLRPVKYLPLLLRAETAQDAVLCAVNLKAFARLLPSAGCQGASGCEAAATAPTASS